MMWFSVLLIFVSASVLFSHSVCPVDVYGKGLGS